MTQASEISNGVYTYEFLTKNKKIVTIMIEDAEENPKFLIKGPKEVIAKVVGGRGEEDDVEAWATDKNLKTETQRMFAILEIMKLIYE